MGGGDSTRIQTRLCKISHEIGSNIKNIFGVRKLPITMGRCSHGFDPAFGIIKYEVGEPYNSYSIKRKSDNTKLNYTQVNYLAIKQINLFQKFKLILLK